MKRVSLRLDERLLAELDACGEVRERGRSAVLRELVVHDLRREREAAIDARYRRGYRDGAPEFRGWEDAGCPLP